jgi:hypothetical protein
VVSLVTTPTPATAGPEGLRRSVADLIRLMRIAGPEAGAPGQ